MSITVATHKLVKLLTDGLETCYLGGGVHIATYRAPWKDEPGDVDLLAATSGTGFVTGHSWIQTEGTLTPSVWPPYNAVNALALCKQLAKKGENHTVDISLVRAEEPENMPEGDHPGWLVTLRETSALFDSDTKLEFHAHHDSKFPLKGIAALLAGRVRRPKDDDKPYVDVPLTVWSAGVLEALSKVAKRHGNEIQMFRSPDHAMQLVQIGPTWLGAARPLDRSPGVDVRSPSAEPVLDEYKHQQEYDAWLFSDSGVVTPEDLAMADADTGEATSEAEARADTTPTVPPTDDKLIRSAVELVVSSQFASAAMIQRKLKIGFAKASRLLTAMEEMQIVGPAEGSKARAVLIPADQLDKALENVDAGTW